jgi:hypothetical protein
VDLFRLGEVEEEEAVALCVSGKPPAATGCWHPADP